MVSGDWRKVWDADWAKFESLNVGHWIKGLSTAWGGSFGGGLDWGFWGIKVLGFGWVLGVFFTWFVRSVIWVVGHGFYWGFDGFLEEDVSFVMNVYLSLLGWRTGRILGLKVNWSKLGFLKSLVGFGWILRQCLVLNCDFSIVYDWRVVKESIGSGIMKFGQILVLEILTKMSFKLNISNPCPYLTI